MFRSREWSKHCVSLNNERSDDPQNSWWLHEIFFSLVFVVASRISTPFTHHTAKEEVERIERERKKRAQQRRLASTLPLFFAATSHISAHHFHRKTHNKEEKSTTEEWSDKRKKHERERHKGDLRQQPQTIEQERSFFASFLLLPPAAHELFFVQRLEKRKRKKGWVKNKGGAIRFVASFLLCCRLPHTKHYHHNKAWNIHRIADDDCCVRVWNVSLSVRWERLEKKDKEKITIRERSSTTSNRRNE